MLSVMNNREFGQCKACVGIKKEMYCVFNEKTIRIVRTWVGLHIEKGFINLNNGIVRLLYRNDSSSAFLKIFFSFV